MTAVTKAVTATTAETTPAIISVLCPVFDGVFGSAKRIDYLKMNKRIFNLLENTLLSMLEETPVVEATSWVAPF